MKLKYLATLVFCSYAIQLNPIHENTAKIGAVAGGAVAGAAAGAALYYFGLKDSAMPPYAKIGLTALAGATVGGISWYFLNEYLHTLTPTGRFQAANKIISLASMDSLIARDFANDEEFIKHANARAGTSWPLVITRDHLMGMRTNLFAARELLNAASAEAQGKYEYGDLCQRCYDGNEKISELMNLIENRLVFITNNQQYQFQVTLREKHLEKERERQAKAHQKELDRNEKHYDRWHDSNEREKDRKNKQKIINQNPDRPILLNV